jgi:small subunit ribosomal protein S6
LRIYELCLIFHNDTTDEQQDQIFQSIADIVAQHSGSVLKTEKWGKKSFKFVIKKQTKGHYCFLVFEAAVTALKEIERNIMYNESILRYNFIRLEKFVAPPAATEVETPAATEVETPAATEVETKVEAEVETKVEAEVETKVEAEVETKVEAEVETKVEAEAKVDTEAEAENGTKTESVDVEQAPATQE